MLCLFSLGQIQEEKWRRDTELAGQQIPPPCAPYILFQLRRDKPFCHHDPAKKLTTKARLMAPGLAALWFQLGSLKPPWKLSLVLGRRKEGRAPGQQHTGSAPSQQGHSSPADPGPGANAVRRPPSTTSLSCFLFPPSYFLQACGPSSSPVLSRACSRKETQVWTGSPLGREISL